ncbi:MAG: amino acid ABC transporter permease [Anaerolineae bacterium]
MERHSAVPFWRDVRVLGALSQVAFLLIVVACAAFFLTNFSVAMRQRGMVIGFDYLRHTAGFEIGEGFIPYRPTDTYGRAYLVGLLNTLLVSGIGIVLATLLGVIIGVARLSTNWLVARLAAAYIEIIRNTPLLVQLVFIYFGVFFQLPPVAQTIELPGPIYANQRGVFLPRPIATAHFWPWLGWAAAGLIVGIGLWKLGGRPRVRRAGLVRGIAAGVIIATPVLAWLAAPPLVAQVPVRERFNFQGGLALSPEFSALLSGLVLYTAGFIAEVVRGGILAVRRGQIEAAQALGLNSTQILRLVIFPQAMRVIVPPLISQYLNLAKNSSLAVYIGFPDLFAVNQTILNQTGQPVPVIALVMATYLTMSLLTSLIMNVYNRHVQILEK